VKLRYVVPAAVVSGFLTVLFHYSVGITLAVFLVAGLILRPIVSAKLRLPFLIHIGLITLLLVGSALYFTLAASGSIMYKLSWLYNGFVPEPLQVCIEKPALNSEALVENTFVSPIKPKPSAPDAPPQKSFIENYEDLVKAGLGLDFVKTNPLGKTFRVLQWAVILFIAAGFIRLVKNKEYIVFSGGAVLLLLLCLRPGFSSILNISRFLHLGLFALAPAFVVGGRYLLRKEYLLLAVLIPYFLFTSGLIFEATKQPSVEHITIPYSIGLSNYRMDLGGSFTREDFEVREYVVSNKLFPLYSDVFGAYFVEEKVGKRPDISRAFPKFSYELQKPSYAFVRSRNMRDGSFTIWNGVGCRKYVRPEEYGIDPNKNIVYQVGDARVLEVK